MSDRRTETILIGPIRAGKSTIGRLLAERLGLPQVSMDTECWNYFREIGFDDPAVEQNGPDGLIASGFILHALERLLADHSGCVFDGGEGHSLHRDPADLDRMKQILAPFPHVVLLLPSHDLDCSSRILAERNRENDWLIPFIEEHGWNPNEHFLRHPSNSMLARRSVTTEGKSPEQTCDEVLALTRPR